MGRSILLKGAYEPDEYSKKAQYDGTDPRYQKEGKRVSNQTHKAVIVFRPMLEKKPRSEKKKARGK